MIARFLTIATEPESDAEWFADHRRQFRVRSDGPGCIIVTRAGSAQHIPMPMHAGLRDADDETLGHMFRAFRQAAAANIQ